MILDLLQNAFDGIAVGSGYALLAIGFTLIFGVLRRLNLSYGPSIMVGTFLGAFLFLQFRAGWYLILLGTVLGTVVAGIYVERLCFRAMKHGAAVASMVSSFAVWMQLEEAITILFPERTYAFPGLGDFDPLYVAGLTMRPEHLMMLGVAIALVLALYGLLYRTSFGLDVRAVSEDPKAALFVGVNPNRVIFLTFMLASVVGGVAGFLIISTEEVVTPKFGLQATFKGLIAMMLGGMGSIPGAIAGGLLLGIVEKQAEWFAGAVWRDVAAYMLLFLFLIFRPGGLLAERSVRRGQAAMRRV